MTKLVIALAAFVVDAVHRGLCAAMRKENPGSCVVLYYHVVTAEQRGRFAEQMDDVVRWTKPMDMRGGSSLAPGIRHTVVTFDDGFTCILDNALPELKSRNIPAMIFVPVGCINSQPGWITDERDPDLQETVMSTDQLIRLRDEGLIRIGSHGVSHSSLLLLDDETARGEIVESKRRLEDLMETGVDSLSFPHGAYRESHVLFAEEAGYRHVFTIMPEQYFGRLDDFVIGRVRVDPSDWRIEFRLKILGAYRWLPAAYRIKKALMKQT